MKYRMAKGIDRSSIVTPVPSGVIIAENIKKIEIAYRQFFFQKSLLIIPSLVNNNIKIGSRNNTPTTNIKTKTDETNSLTEKKGIAPIAEVYE